MKRLVALGTVLALVVYTGAEPTVSGYTASLANSTDTVSMAANTCMTRPLADSPTRFYPLNETTGTTAFDLSPSAANGVYQGGRQTVSVAAYPCVRDTQAYAVLDTLHFVSTTGALTISATTSQSHEAWFRTVTGVGVITGFGDTISGASTKKDNLLVVTTSGKIGFLTYNGVNYEILSSFAFNDGAWHHVVGVHDASFGIRLYLDGALMTSLAGAHPETVTGYVRIGYESTAGYTNGFGSSQLLAHFVGNLAFVAYYPYALSAAQVLAHYNAGR
ncbi:LamG domain-containing protein [Actinosynnema sp. NPDC020468]|uniref:LamG domain-containing protein n=1 Tax=Actinosynnema sp. NPDC020468 TaxID=3154488 RepID=UPI0033E37306